MQYSDSTKNAVFALHPDLRKKGFSVVRGCESVMSNGARSGVGAKLCHRAPINAVNRNLLLRLSPKHCISAPLTGCQCASCAGDLEGFLRSIAWQSPSLTAYYQQKECNHFAPETYGYYNALLRKLSSSSCSLSRARGEQTFLF